FAQMQAKYLEHGYGQEAAIYDKDFSEVVSSSHDRFLSDGIKRIVRSRDQAYEEQLRTPSDPKLLLEFAEGARVLGENTRALDLYDKVIELKPQDKEILSESYHGKALVLLNAAEEKNEHGILEITESLADEHITYLNKSIQVDPNNVIAQRNLGFAQYYFKSDKKAALDSYNKALKLIKGGKYIKDKEMKIREYSEMIKKIKKELGIKT
ncbi:MAG: hypothetical protein MK137_09555, partial [Rickettsiales bacterium]|nr:hypothetical protein [Rickettsiales bacterium]